MLKRAFVALILASPAYGQVATIQVPCGPYDVIHTQLSGKYQESPSGRGLTQEGLMVEFWQSPAGGFSVLVVNPNGIACMVSSGEAWEAVEIAAPGPNI
jgi:hypothetical protein